MAELFRTIAFRAVQIILFPLGLVGYVVFTIRLITFSRRTGISATVLASLYTRYMLDRLGVRSDEPAVRLMMVMPNVSRVALYLVTAPTLAAHRLTGYVPHIYRYPYEGEPPMGHQPPARTTYYDETVARYLGDVEQFVILGAGFDTRVFRLPPDSHVRCFEIDEPRTQAFKLEMLGYAGLETSRATYISADFQIEDWFEKLTATGFDPARPSLFTWESVTMYLDREAVETSLRKIATTAPGTVIAFDYFSDEIIESDSPFMRYARAMIKVVGEPWHFGIDNTPPVRTRVADFLASCGLTLLEQRNFGQETDKVRAMAGFAIAIVPSPASPSQN